MPTVYDASALLALVLDEPGADRALKHLSEGVISTVNLSEVMATLASRGATRDDLEALIDDLPLDVEAFTIDDTVRTALLRPDTRSFGLSLGDRACLALGLRLDAPILTADRAWSGLPQSLASKVELIR